MIDYDPTHCGIGRLPCSLWVLFNAVAVTVGRIDAVVSIIVSGQQQQWLK